MRSRNIEMINRDEITKFIVSYLKKHCYAPTHTEIANSTNLSTATVKRHIERMIEDGQIETEHPGEPRAYRIKNTKIVGKKNE
ncbi:MAG: winged helix-turn-helix transcriptional regulator [Lachnospiraceae bacterium]|nr:winged helix-turn-helix transcriptional regulator [Lachnospiraceae bacterium]